MFSNTQVLFMLKKVLFAPNDNEKNHETNEQTRKESENENKREKINFEKKSENQKS
jgi:flagella basal body P-ring formation protein FlgA